MTIDALRTIVDEVAADRGAVVIDLDTVRVGAPVPWSGKVVWVGLNYRARGRDGHGHPDRADPVAEDAVHGARAGSDHPPGSQKTDCEVEAPS